MSHSVKILLKIIAWLAGIAIVGVLGVIAYMYFFVHVPFQRNLKASLEFDYDKLKAERMEYIVRHQGKFKLNDCDICIPVQEPSGVFYNTVKPNNDAMSPEIRHLIFNINFDYICQNSKERCSSSMDIRSNPPNNTYVNTGVVVADPKAGVIHDLFDNESDIKSWQQGQNVFELYILDSQKYIYNSENTKELAGYDNYSNPIAVSCLKINNQWSCKFYVGIKDKNVTISYHLPYEYLSDWQLINEFILNFISCTKREE
ncbi:MAG: hypothetical protein K1X44_00015 [Alphaproteobacteria bacterium]|nr:hypothetical protein [Alphaproteobacteria bacterium]